MSNQVGGVEVGAVEEVEKFRPELEVQAFTNSRFLHRREIPGGQPRASVRVAPHISKESAVVGRRDECVGIEPLIRISEDHRARESRIQKCANRVACISVVRWVVTKLRSEGKSGLRGHDAVECPSACQKARCATLTAQKSSPASEGEFVTYCDNPDVPDIVRCESPICLRVVRI